MCSSTSDLVGRFFRRAFAPSALLCVAPYLAVGLAIPGWTAGQASSSASVLKALPLRFTENRGQWPEAESFVAKRAGAVIRADTGGMRLELPGPAGAANRLLARLAFVVDGPASALEGVDPLPGLEHFFLGRDSTRWRTGVPAFAGVVWRSVWPGVDAWVRDGTAPAIVEYGFDVAPGVDASVIRLSLDAGDRLEIHEDGAIEVRTALGVLRQTPPRAYERLANGERREISCRFSSVGIDSFSFDIDRVDASVGLFIDPGLVWGSYLGGNGDDIPRDLLVLATGEPVIAGNTYSTDFPTTPGAYQVQDGASNDAFVTRTTASGDALVFSTYIGASGIDAASAIAAFPSGGFAVAGATKSTDFPVTEFAWDKTLAGGTDGFVLKLSQDGSQLRFATLIGGVDTVDNFGDEIREIAVSDAIYVAGMTTALDFPTTAGAFQPMPGGDSVYPSWDAFVARLSLDGSLLHWGTYLGGARREVAWDLALDSPDGLIAVGETDSSNFPTLPAAFDAVYSGQLTNAGFVVRLSSASGAGAFSTFLDGCCGSTQCYAVDVNSAGVIAVAGLTGSSEFPTTPGVLDTTVGFLDTFVALLTSDGSTLVASTFLGNAAGVDTPSFIDLEDSGAVTVCGRTDWPGFPMTPGAFDSLQLGSGDLFATRLKPGLVGLLYSSLLGGGGGSLASSLTSWGGAVDAQGDLWLIASDSFASFPVTPAVFDPTWSGAGPQNWGEGVIAKMELQPLGVTSLGAPTNACNGPIRLTALGLPTAGNSAFAVACTGAPAASLGALVASATSATGGLPLLGVTLYVDFAPPLIVLPGAADANGYREFGVPLPASAVGIVATLQAVWIDTGGCGGSLAFSASDALQMTIGTP